VVSSWTRTDNEERSKEVGYIQRKNEGERTKRGSEGQVLYTLVLYWNSVLEGKSMDGLAACAPLATK